MLRVRGLCADHGRARVLRDVSLDVAEGAAWLLLGRNGAGKSTTLKAMIGLLRPAAGSIRFLGHEIAGRASFRIARLGLGYVPEERRIFTDLTVAENLVVGARGRDGSGGWTSERVFALFPNLAAMRHRNAGRMSGGEQQMLAIARTLMGNPRLLLLDEPSEGLAPLVVRQLAEALLALKRDGMAMLLAEQNMRFGRHVGDHAAILEQGRVAWSGSLAALEADAAAQARYLAA